MGLSQSQVEVLLRMRAEGQQALDTFAGGLGKVGASGKQAASGVDEAAKSTRTLQGASVAAGVAIGLLAERVARGLVGAFRNTIDAANQLDAGLVGLSSIARAFGQDVEGAKAAAQRLAADGLLTVGEAAAGLKNLLAAGFGLSEAVVLMERFKDSAAFGRQGALSFGQAVVSATEGIKNGNCLVGDTLILCEDGRQVPIRELYERGQAVRVYSLCADGSLRLQPVSHVFYNGRRPVFRLTLESGKAVVATANHRFLTPRGFRFLSQLQAGDVVLTVEPADDILNSCDSVGTVSRSQPRAAHNGASPAARDTAGPAANRFTLGRRGRAQPSFAAGSVRVAIRAAIRAAVVEVAARDSSSVAATSAASRSRRSAGWWRRASGAIARLAAAIRRVLAFAVRDRLAFSPAFACAANGVVPSATGSPRSLGRFDSARGRAGTSGSAPGWPARITPIGEAGDATRRTASAISRPISGGGPPSWRETVIDAVAAVVQSRARRLTPITSCASLTTPAAPLTLTTGSRSAKDATHVYTLNAERVVSIDYAGEEDVYDLSVPGTRTIVANSMVTMQSILVDNAGVTKNLSIILQEAGFAATDLSRASSDANVRMALFRGIVKETNPVVGDAQRLLQTSAGAMAQFEAATTRAQQAVGKQLQPVLAGLLGVLQPALGVIERHPEAFVRLASAVAAVVGPLAAFKAASALGLTHLAQLGSTAVATAGSLLGSVRSFADARAAIQALGASAGLTVASLGKLGTAAAVAGAAFIGWQLGRLIGDLTGATAAIERWASAAGRAALASETAGAKQDVINRAIALGAEKTITYAQAVEFLQQKERERLLLMQEAEGRELAQLDLRRKQLQAAFERAIQDKALSTEQEVRRRVELEDQLALIAAEEQRLKAQANRQSLAGALAAAERQVQQEIRATGLSTSELTARLAQNEDAFKKWAEQHGLSAATVKVLEERLKQQKEAQEKAADAAKKQQEAIEKQREALEQLGLVTLPKVQERLKELDGLTQRARAEGIDLATAVRALWPEYEKLAAQAKAAGVGVDLVTAAMDRQARSAGLVLTGTRDLSRALQGMVAPTVEVTEATRDLLAQAHADIQAQEQRAAAYRFFGLQTREELQAQAREAIAAYERIRADGTATPAQIREAHERMVRAVNEATGKIPTFWQTEVAPGVTRVLQTLESAVSGSFAQMLLGAKSFHDGFVDIWKSIKAAVLNIFNEIVEAFLKGVLARIIGALSGGRAGITGGFGSLLGGLFGGGGGGAGVAGAGAETVLLPGVLPPGGGVLAGGGLSLAGLFGGLGAGAAGFGLGELGKLLFGGKGAAAGTFGGASGFASGALLGSILPGIGTLVGGIIGGLSGVISGLFGEPSKKELAGRDLVAQFEDFLASSLTAQQQLEAGGERWKQTVIAVRDAYLATGRSEQEALAIVERLWAASKKGPEEVRRVIAEIVPVLEAAKAKTQETAQAMDAMGTAGTQAGDRSAEAVERAKAALVKAREEYEALAASGTASAEALATAQARVQAAEQAVLDATRAAAEGYRQGAQEAISATEDLEAAHREAMRRIREQGGITGDALEATFERIATSAVEQIQGAAGDIGRLLRDIEVPEIRVPVRYDVGELPTGGGGGRVEIPGAQHGIFATRPTLRVFAEREPELGGPIDFMTKALAGALARLGTAGGPVQIVLTLNGRQIAEAIVPEIPAVVRRYGLT